MAIWGKKKWKENENDDWSLPKEKKLKGKEAQNCSWVENYEGGKKMRISDDVLNVIRHLCYEIKIEWQLFLIGYQNEEVVVINDYYIPKQEVTGASVINLECVDAQFLEEHGIIASMHSHGRMDVFFSSTDQVTNRGPIKYHIVVNNKLDYTATQQVQTPCGLIGFKPLVVNFGNVKDITVKNIENISEKTIEKIEAESCDMQLPLSYNAQGRVHASKFGRKA